MTMMIIELTADEQEQLAEMRATLHADGYRNIDEHTNLRVGARIRHTSQMWPQAYTAGTGVVAALTEKPDSGWTQTWGVPDIELVAVWDTPLALAATRLSRLPHYRVAAVDPDDHD